MSGKRVAVYFVAFFGLIVAVNTGMATMALRTHSGLVTDHAYEKGLRYNQLIAAEQQQAALGWHSRADYADGMLRFELRDAEDKPITPEKATAYFTRPTKQGMDFTSSLSGSTTPVRFPANGLWEMRIEAVHAGTPYQHTQRIVVP